MTPPAPEPTRPLVIGLAGGIGAGKSAAAAALADLGCLVSDSDDAAKAELDVPEVRDQLVAWWGEAILAPDGSPDRRAIAAIVFQDSDQRRRLEGLIHPRLKAARASMIERGAALGVPAVVIDAPLLFEAGLDAECDAILFIDAPREARLARVRAARGWDEAELDRREAAQLPLDEKKARSTAVIANTGDARALRGEVRRFFEDRLLQDRFLENPPRA